MLKADLIDTRLRALSHDEITGVAGGDIVVNGYRPSGGDNWWDRMPMFTYDYSNGIFSGDGGGWGGGGGSAGPGPELVDTDGDGVPDSPEIVVIADPNQIRDVQTLANLADQQATGIMFALAVAWGWERASGDAALAVLSRMFGSAQVAGAVAAGAGFIAAEVTHAELSNMLNQIHLNDWEADGRSIQMPQVGDWDYVGDPRDAPRFGPLQ